MTSNDLDALTIARSLSRFLRLLDRQLRCDGDDDLGLAEFGILAELSRGAELPSAIARATQLDPARVTRVVERLVALGYVSRRASAHDRRQSPLEITGAGQERIERGREHIRRLMSQLLEGLTPYERAALETALVGIQRVLDAGGLRDEPVSLTLSP